MLITFRRNIDEDAHLVDPAKPLEPQMLNQLIEELREAGAPPFRAVGSQLSKRHDEWWFVLDFPSLDGQSQATAWATIQDLYDVGGMAGLWHFGGLDRGAPVAPAGTALERINAHRRKLGERPLDPIAAGWSPEDVEIEAQRIDRLNPVDWEAKERLLSL